MNAKNMQWLEERKAIESNGLKKLVTIFQSKGTFCIIGNGEGTGITTVQNLISEMLQEKNKDPIILPSIKAKTLTEISKTPQWRDFKKVFKFDQYIILICLSLKKQLTTMTFDEQLSKLGNGPTFVIEMQKLASGKRIIHRILKKTKGSFKVLYLYKVP